MHLDRNSSRSKHVFYCSKGPDRLWGPHSFLFNGYVGFFPGVKRPGREADHSHPSSAEVKNECRYNSSPLCFHGLYRDGFSFYLNESTQMRPSSLVILQRRFTLVNAKSAITHLGNRSLRQHGYDERMGEKRLYQDQFHKVSSFRRRYGYRS